VPRRRALAAVKSRVQTLASVLGFRPDYVLDNVLVAAGALLSVASWLLGLGLSGMVASGLVLGLPLFLAALSRLRYTKRIVQFPLSVVIMSTVAALFNPPLIVVALIYSMLIEDFSVFLSFDVVRVAKRTARLLIAPISRKETLVVILVTTVSGVVSYLVTSSPVSLLYPVISYGMIAYSVIIRPPEYMPKDVKVSLLEELSRRAAVLQYLFNKIYMSQGMRRLAKQAGMFGYDYIAFIKKMTGVFTLSVYVSLAAAPLLSILVGDAAYLLPLVAFAVFLAAPYIVLSNRKRSRSGKVARNTILIISYMAAMKSVAESFTNMMMLLKNNPNLAKLFGMEDEANLYYKIYISKRDEHLAEHEYADTIPDDFFRDTVRSMIDIEENEGIGAAFRMLVNRLREYTGRYIDRVSNVFNNVASNMISVALLFQTTLPAVLLTSNPGIIPLVILAGGVMSAAIAYSIASATLPELPTEFTHTKRRLRMAAVVFSVVGAGLLVAERVLLPEYLLYEGVLNIPVALGVAMYYASYEDLYINNKLLEKFSDLLTLFTSSLARHGSVEHAFMELSEQATFPPRLRKLFRDMARMFKLHSIQRLDYKGPYWYKYLLFLSSLTVIYGTTPRELYKAISSFMLEFKRFINSVRSFGSTVIVLVLVGLLIMTIEFDFAAQFASFGSTINKQIRSSSSVLGVQQSLPSLSPAELKVFEVEGVSALLGVAILNGLAVGRVMSGTLRDGRFALLFYVAELLLLFVAAKTHFGIVLAPGR